jgi:hypothetical protein
MKCEIGLEIPEGWEPTGEVRPPVMGETFLCSDFFQTIACSRDLPPQANRIILRRVEPPKPVLRAFKGPEEVPGHLVWARLKSFDGDGRRVAFSPLSYGLVLLGSLTVDYKDAVNDVELAGTDLVWVPAGIEE